MSDIDGAMRRVAAAGAAAGALRPLPDLAPSTSRATMRPCGPEPLMRASSMPASLARRRASGDEKTRAWPLAFEAACGRLRRRCRSRRCCGRCRRGRGGRRERSWLSRRVPRRPSCRCSARASRLHVLAVAGQNRDDIVDRHVLRALGHQDLRDRAFVDGFNFHRRLVGLDLRDHVAGLDLVALFLEPLGKVALFHRGRQRGHQNVDRHCQ